MRSDGTRGGRARSSRWRTQCSTGPAPGERIGFEPEGLET